MDDVTHRDEERRTEREQRRDVSLVHTVSFGSVDPSRPAAQVLRRSSLGNC
jgi:hypothetical protein